MARKSIVLLKNDSQTLPLKKSIKTIAVIGPNADNPTCLLGNYNGSPSNIVTPLEGIRKKAGKSAKVIYHQGVGLTDDTISMAINLGNALKIDGKAGFKAEYFSNKRFEGNPVFTQYEKTIDLFGANQHKVLSNFETRMIAARWTSILTPGTDGDIVFEMTGDDSGFRLFIDGEKVVDRFGYQEARIEYYRLAAKKGKTYRIQFEFAQETEAGGVSLATVRREKTDMKSVAAQAKQADVIVFVGGISPSLEGEDMPVEVPGFNKGDRTSIALPAVQTAMLKELAATGKPVVFVMLTGSALAVEWEKNNLPAIVNAWYGGQDAGTALADVLFGDYNPSGRLPVTFYASDKDLPDYEDYDMHERTYRYFTGKPLFEFGHGLSYTRFEYSNMTAPETLKTGETAKYSITVTNKGTRDGEEVAQLYVSLPDANVPVPIRSLQGIQRVYLKAGESKEITFSLSPVNFSAIDVLMQRCVMSGKALVSIGGGQASEVALNEGRAQQKTTELTGSKYIIDN